MPSATHRFYLSIDNGNLPIQYDDGRFGLMGGGLNLVGDARAQAMVYSGDSTTRAAASIIACTQARNLSSHPSVAARA
jgi:hypothetical protein